MVCHKYFKHKIFAVLHLELEPVIYINNYKLYQIAVILISNGIKLNLLESKQHGMEAMLYSRGRIHESYFEAMILDARSIKIVRP